MKAKRTKPKLGFELNEQENKAKGTFLSFPEKKKKLKALGSEFVLLCRWKLSQL
jgi:hypothetical protein